MTYHHQDDPIDAPLTSDQPAPANVLGREGVDEDLAAVATEADDPDDDLDDEDGDDEMDDTNAGEN